MHPESMVEMERLLKLVDGHGDALEILDVGSLDVNGTYRGLVEGFGWQYTGLDIVPGRNVDIVSNPDDYPFENETFDGVISGSTLEHVAHPWRWIKEVTRVLKPGGFLIILTHHQYPLHRYPKDYWRFMPDGLRLLFDETGCLHQYGVAMFNETDIYGVAVKIVK